MRRIALDAYRRKVGVSPPWTCIHPSINLPHLFTYCHTFHTSPHLISLSPHRTLTARWDQSTTTSRV